MNFSSTYVYLFSILILYSLTAYSQTNGIDSLKRVLQTQKADTNKVKTLLVLSDSYEQYYPDSGLVYAQKALALAEKLQYDEGIFWSEFAINASLYFVGNYPLELDYAYKALSLSKKLNTPKTIAYANGMLSDYYYNLGNYNTSLYYWREIIAITEKWFPDKM